MKIGLIAYPTVCNFGANLQMLSTLEYFRKRNIDIEIINWLPLSLEGVYKRGTSEAQYKAHEEFRKKYYTMSRICRTAEEVARVIEDDNITGVIVGSDAVAQHHPFLDRIVFPSSRVIRVLTLSEDRMFPNVFWGTFQQYLKKKVPMAVMSASCQNSPYTTFGSDIKKAMVQCVSEYKYLSVRDEWTQQLYKYVTGGVCVPKVTPDPVFAFNYNVDYVPSKEETLKKFSFPERYILVSFNKRMRMSKKWIMQFCELAHRHNYTCVALTYPNILLFDDVTDKVIKTPLDPLDWYSIIKYSSGYVGNNMHPIVVSIHNCVPFFSFDNYGVTHLKLFYNKQSSKIFDILKRAGFEENRCNVTTLTSRIPNPKYVFEKIVQFDKEKCNAFSVSWHDKYTEMMDKIIVSLQK